MFAFFRRMGIRKSKNATLTAGTLKRAFHQGSFLRDFPGLEATGALWFENPATTIGVIDRHLNGLPNLGRGRASQVQLQTARATWSRGAEYSDD
jgi:hypothetical protein